MLELIAWLLLALSQLIVFGIVWWMSKDIDKLRASVRRLERLHADKTARSAAQPQTSAIQIVQKKPDRDA